MLADAEVEVAARVIAGLEVAGAVESQARLGGRGQVGRAAHQPGDVPGDRVQDQARRVPSGHPLAVGGEGRQARIPAVGELAMLHPVELVGQLGVLGLVLLDPAEPGIAQLLATPAHPLVEVLVDAVGHEELGVLGPAVVAFGEPDFVLAQRLAVGGAGVLLVGRAPADVAVDDDQGRPLALLEEDAEGAVEQVQVVGVADPGDVPAVAQETGGDVLGEGQRGVPLDRDVVVVVDPAEVGELPMGGERGGLGGDALHHAAVAAEGVDVEVDQVLEAGAVVACGHPAARQRHADAVGHALPERPGRRLDARGPAVLRVARDSGCATAGTP